MITFTRRKTPQSLSHYNQQVLQCQDDAYTAAYYLSGNAAEAELITQLAVEKVFQTVWDGQLSCRIPIFQQVVRLCGRKSWRAEARGKTKLETALEALSPPERESVVLVDLIHLSYREAAIVMERSVNEIAALLTQARKCISATIFDDEADEMDIYVAGR